MAENERRGGSFDRYSSPIPNEEKEAREAEQQFRREIRKAQGRPVDF